MRNFNLLPTYILIEITKFLFKMEIANSFILISKRHSELLIQKEYSYQHKQYMLLKNNYKDYPVLIDSIIKNGFWELLLEPIIKNKLNLETILSLKYEPFPLLYALEQSQISLHLQYLQKAKLKKQNFEIKIKEKIKELKKYQFEELQLPTDKIETIELNSNENFINRENRFAKMLQIFEEVIKRDLENHKENFRPEKFEFLKLFFKIIFWKKDNIGHYQTNSDELKNLSQKFITRYKINMNNSENKGPDWLNILHRGENIKVNGFLLAAEIGNLHFLEDFKESLQFLACNHPIKNHPLQNLLPTAARLEQETVLQFLLEHNFRCRSAIYEAIKHKKYIALILLISHGFNLNASFFAKKTPWQTLCTNKIDYMNLLILHIAGISVDTEILISKPKASPIKVSLLKNLLENINFDFELYNNKTIPLDLINKAEGIRLLLCLGANYEKLNEKQTQAMKYMLYIAKSLGSSINIDNIEEKKSALIDISSLFNTSFYKYQKKESFLCYSSVLS